MRAFEMGFNGWKLAMSGALMWLLGTVYFYFRAGRTFESGPLLYAVNAGLTVVLYVFAFRWLAGVFKIPRGDWGRAALWFILPGMIGEIPVLLNFPATLPTLAPASAAGYAAFLFCGYVSVGLYALIADRNRKAGAAADHL